MMRNRILVATGLSALASPAFAAEAGMFSLSNPLFVVSISFIAFLLVVAYLGVHKIVAKMLDGRAESIRNEIDEARKLQEEAKQVLADFERKRKEVAEHSKAVIEQAQTEAETAAEQARADLKDTIARRLAAAEDQIKSAQDAAVREVRDKAVVVAIAAARDVISKGMTPKDANTLLDAAINDVGAKLH
jgi:F-type H+-transporting ATPase subunit b